MLLSTHYAHNNLITTCNILDLPQTTAKHIRVRLVHASVFIAVEELVNLWPMAIKHTQTS